MQPSITALCLLLAALSPSCVQEAQAAGDPLTLTFADVTVPGVEPAKQTVSGATGINNAGMIAGFYSTPDPNDPGHGFALKKGIVTLGPSSLPYPPFNANNDAGITTGGYTDASGVWQSFLWYPDGNITYLPSAGVPGPNSFTYMLAINNRGLVVGFVGSDPGDSGSFQPIVYEHGKYNLLQIPGAQSGVAWGVNDRDQVVGWYSDASGAHHQFLKTGKDYTSFELGDGVFFTGINNRGQIVGFLTDSRGTAHGLLFDNGVETLVDRPGSEFTLLYAINDHGEAVGLYGDKDGFAHAFQVTIGNPK